MAVTPATITAVSSTPLMRSSKAPAISSIANTTPASGVLKAAAMPAAAPASTRCRLITGSVKPKRRPTESSRLAPTCTVGPSRPTEAPPPIASTVSPILASAMRTDSSPARQAPSVLESAALTCGMPEPRVAASLPCVTQASATKVIGVTSNGQARWWARSRSNRPNAASHSQAKTTAARPTRTAPPQYTRRRRQRPGDHQSCRAQDPRMTRENTRQTPCFRSRNL